MYRKFRPQTVCASCGATPKSGTTFSRHSPDAYSVSLHLREQLGSNYTVQSTDHLCSSCYKLHLSVMKAVEMQEQSPDSTLQNSIDIWEMKCSDGSCTALTKAVLKAVLHVSEHLLHQKAMLLPDVCHIFLEAFGISHYGSIASVDLHLEVGNSTVRFSSRWLLHQLIIYLHPYMQYKCIHMKFGIVSQGR